MVRRILCLLVCLIFPSAWAIIILRGLGYSIGKKVRIGFSIVFPKYMVIENGCRIGHFNIIINQLVTLKEDSFIGSFNIFKGPFSLILCKSAAIGKFNYITRGELGISYGDAELFLGELSKLTAYHHIDLIRSVRFGNYSILAGIRSQIWTHGFLHANQGPERLRVDGEVIIGNNVYIGSGTIINPGVIIADSINIGSNSSVGKSLLEPGMYVSQPLRYISKSYDDAKTKFRKIDAEGLIGDVYEK